ncbi:hypothetical protein VAEKB19_6260011 [Vibrio aestuarianus]|nr:hypothetical protein VAEKB19_6260011 [Vibrio aestuarianus]
MNNSWSPSLTICGGNHSNLDDLINYIYMSLQWTKILKCVMPYGN